MIRPNLQLFILIGFLKYVCCEIKLKKPIILEHPINTHGLNSQRVILRCAAEGEPQPKIEWYKDGRVVESYKDKPVTSNRHVKGNELLFLHLDTQDEGVYQCNASNTKGWVMSNNASVQIVYLNKNIVGPESRLASVGETVSMNCRPPHGVPEPRVLWKYNGNMLDTNKRIKIMPSGALRIDNASRSDSGRYTCVVKNLAYEIESESAMLTVRQKPQFKVAPSNIEVRVNEAAVLVCVVEGDPRPTIVWRRDNGKDIATSRASLVEDRGLRIGRVQLSDAGNYLCQARNSAGTIEAVARLSVVSAPGFLETPESQEVRVGDTVKFACHISGSPRPTVIWVHNGRHFIADEDLVSGTERMTTNKDGSLVIANVKVSDAGKYECKASSYTGTIQSSAILTVIDSQHYLPPVIDIGPQNQTLRVGLTATFNCQPKQPDDVNIFWLKNSQSLNSISDPRIIQLTSGTLKINLLRPGDAGNYSCRIERKNAFTTWSVFLKILEKNDLETPILQTTDDSRMFPATPTNFEVVKRGDSWIVFKWDTNPQELNDNAINHYLIESSSYESRRGWFQQSMFLSSPGKITNLRANTGYRFLLRSVNDIAIGRPNVLPFVVFTTKKQPSSALTYNELKTKIDNVFCENLKLKSVSTDQITVLWHVAGSNTAIRLLSGFLAVYRQVPLSRCLDNNKEGFMEHCSLGDNLLTQVEMDMNNPKSIFNEEGQEQTKPILVSDWNDGTAAYTIISGLKPFVCYELYVKPYVDHSKFGRLTGIHSKAKTVLTYDSVPTKSPQDLTARWISNTSVEISWQPTPKQYINGILKGYALHIIGNGTNSTRSIEVSPRSTTVRVKDLILHMPYVVHIAATTCQGEGIRSAGLVLTASNNLITLSPHLYGGKSSHENVKIVQIPVAKQPWFISIMVVGGCLWVIICVFIIVVCRGIYVRGLIYKSGYSNGTKLISNSNSQVATESMQGRLASHQSIPPANIYESNSSGMYKDSLILQPLMSLTNNGTINESKTDIGENFAYQMSVNTKNNNSSVNNISNQRRFQDSISNNSASSVTSSNQRAINTSNNSSSNVQPYACASLLQQVIGISTKNNIKNYNYSVGSSSTHRNILMPFSDPNLTSINQDLPSSHLYPLTATDWAANSQSRLDKLGNGTVINNSHAIPPPPQFPPPPAPVSPTASNSTYYLQHDPNGDYGTCSYASCPIDVPISGASTTLSPVPGYLWSAIHNSLIPVQGYVDYACIPYNMTHNSDNGSIASSFALPPPHDMLSLTHFSDDPYSPGSNGTGSANTGHNGMTNDVLSSMISGHLSNESNTAIPSGGCSANSAASNRDYKKYDAASRSGRNDSSNSALDEDDDEDADKSEDGCDEESTRCHKSVNSDPINGWPSPRSVPTSLMNSIMAHGSNFAQRGHLHFPPAQYTIDEATYDICGEDQQPLFNRNNHFLQTSHQEFFPQPSNVGFYQMAQFPDQMINCYDNPPTGQLNTTGVNPFVTCGYLGETPIV